VDKWLASPFTHDEPFPWTTTLALKFYIRVFILSIHLGKDDLVNLKLDVLSPDGTEGIPDEEGIESGKGIHIHRILHPGVVVEFSSLFVSRHL
jgi:hypothetical protein